MKILNCKLLSRKNKGKTPGFKEDRLMKNEMIDVFYNNTYDIIEDKLGTDNVDEETYRKYLSKKYINLIEILDPKDHSEKLHSFIMNVVEDEKRYLTKLTKDQILSILIEDTAFDKIKRFSQFVFEEAKTRCEILNDDDQYNKRIEDITHLLNDVKPYNLESAKVLVSEAILDLGRIYGKNKNLTSLRLASIETRKN